VVGASVAPFAQCRLNEAFGLSVGLRSVRPGEDLTDASPRTRCASQLFWSMVWVTPSRAGKAKCRSSTAFYCSPSARNRASHDLSPLSHPAMRRVLLHLSLVGSVVQRDGARSPRCSALAVPILLRFTRHCCAPRRVAERVRVRKNKRMNRARVAEDCSAGGERASEST
jgi:hypothetical protein